MVKFNKVKKREKAVDGLKDKAQLTETGWHCIACDKDINGTR